MILIPCVAMDPLQSLCGRKKQEIIYQNPKYVLIISSSSSSIPSDSVEEEVEAVLYVTGVCEIQIGGEKRSLGYEKEEEILKILVEEFIDISVKKKEVQLLKSLLEIICKEVCVLFFCRCSSVHCLEVSHRLIAIQI
ncbi:uncharacterized protein LOC112188254 isoform X3 [Rosa chinensis]|uniref:uncharacterized protein LOC112188254 isoform X3 n=1 Tax=Rosa chinensis TaxID=74649 RepID=UPI001AD8CB32|nr:uncharacterized protein LOC112188254 isoform X3 [Rosa chinensis]